MGSAHLNILKKIAKDQLLIELLLETNKQTNKPTNQPTNKQTTTSELFSCRRRKIVQLLFINQEGSYLSQEIWQLNARLQNRKFCNLLPFLPKTAFKYVWKNGGMLSILTIICRSELRIYSLYVRCVRVECFGYNEFFMFIQ